MARHEDLKGILRRVWRFFLDFGYFILSPETFIAVAALVLV